MEKLLGYRSELNVQQSARHDYINILQILSNSSSPRDTVELYKELGYYPQNFPRVLQHLVDKDLVSVDNYSDNDDKRSSLGIGVRKALLQKGTTSEKEIKYMMWEKRRDGHRVIRVLPEENVMQACQTLVAANIPITASNIAAILPIEIQEKFPNRKKLKERVSATCVYLSNQSIGYLKRERKRVLSSFEQLTNYPSEKLEPVQSFPYTLLGVEIPKAQERIKADDFTEGRYVRAQKPIIDAVVTACERLFSRPDVSLTYYDIIKALPDEIKINWKTEEVLAEHIREVCVELLDKGYLSEKQLGSSQALKIQITRKGHALNNVYIHNIALLKHGQRSDVNINGMSIDRITQEVITSLPELARITEYSESEASWKGKAGILREISLFTHMLTSGSANIYEFAEAMKISPDLVYQSIQKMMFTGIISEFKEKNSAIVYSLQESSEEIVRFASKYKQLLFSIETDNQTIKSISETLGLNRYDIYHMLMFVNQHHPIKKAFVQSNKDQENEVLRLSKEPNLILESIAEKLLELLIINGGSISYTVDHQEKIVDTENILENRINLGISNTDETISQLLKIENIIFQKLDHRSRKIYVAPRTEEDTKYDIKKSANYLLLKNVLQEIVGAQNEKKISNLAIQIRRWCNRKIKVFTFPH